MPPSLGAVVSLTVTTNESDAPPEAHVTVVFPSANVEPEAGVQPILRAPLTGSVAVGDAYVTTAPDGPVASAVTSFGTPVNVVLPSVTVTVKLVLTSLRPSETRQETVVVPIGKFAPDGGLQSVWMLPTASLACG